MVPLDKVYLSFKNQIGRDKQYFLRHEIINQTKKYFKLYILLYLRKIKITNLYWKNIKKLFIEYIESNSFYIYRSLNIIK